MCERGMRVREQVVHVVRHVFVIVILLSCHIFIYYTHAHSQTPAMFCLLRTIPSDLNMLTSSFSCWAYCLVNPEDAAVTVACITLNVLR